MSEYMLLDTDIFSYLIKNHSQAEKFRPQLSGKILCLSFISIGELYYGAYSNSWGENRTNDLQRQIDALLHLPYKSYMPEMYARLMAACKTKGKPIALNDAWIAATAIAYEIPLLTNNTRHFCNVDGLILI